MKNVLEYLENTTENNKDKIAIVEENRRSSYLEVLQTSKKIGSELTKYGFLKKKKMNEEAKKLLNSLDIQIPDVTVSVGNLSGGQRQGVAVARLVHNGGKLLIFDEPTAAMGLNESNAVLKLIKKLAGEGFTVIIISHNLPQVFYISDRICVMRQGKVIKELKTQDTTMDEVVSMITGAITTD